MKIYYIFLITTPIVSKMYFRISFAQSSLLVTLVVLSINTTTVKNNNSHQCANTRDPCDRNYWKPCCSENVTCQRTGSADSFICKRYTFLGMPCNINKDCDEIWDANCSTEKKCVCRLNYVEYNSTICLPLLGEFCLKSYKCLVNNSDCIDNLCKCKDGYISRLNNKCIANIIESPCVNDTICQNIKFAKCINGLCKCSSNTMLVNKAYCASILDGFCWDNNDCIIDNSTCIDDKCQCKTGFTPRSNNMCREGRLNMTCITDEQCSHVIDYAICSGDKNCICDINYLPLNETKCAPMMNQLCEYDEPCAIKNSGCIDNKCQCKPKYISKANECLPKYLNGSCDDDKDCREIFHAKCSKDQKCVCDQFYIKLNETMCGPKLNGLCFEDQQCTVSHSYCIENRCRCKPDYLSVLNDQCLAIKLGQSCNDISDCQKISNAICSSNGQCDCESNYVDINKTVCAPKLYGHCENHMQCVTTNAVCINDKCQCQPDFSSRYDDECIINYLGMMCTNENDCKRIQYAECSKNKKCVCKLNYVQSNPAKCAPVLGQYCNNDSQCATDNSICLKKKCKCKLNYVKRFNNQCIPIYLQEACKNNDDCEEIKFSICSEDKKCICNSNYISIKNIKCEAVINAYCTKNSDCFPDNSNCIDNKCQCIENFLFRSNRECTRNHNDYYYCRNNKDCEQKMYSVCSKDSVCVCKDNYVVIDSNVCAPLLNAYCETGDQCALTNSICIDNKCQCNVSCVLRLGNQCLPTHLNSYCEYDTDCDEIKYSKCSKDKKCVCQNNYFALNETTCTLYLGKYCSTYKQCIIKHAVCSNNQCQCKLNFISVSNKQCLPQFSKKFCHTNDDCSDILNAECTNNNKCGCETNYVALNNTMCAPLVGGFCLENENCVVTNSICNNNKCQCKRYYTPTSNNQCVLLTLGKPCIEDIDCSMIPHSVCSNDKVCACKINHIAMDERTCVPVLGGYCLNDDQCRYNESHCIDNTCQCKPMFSSVSTSQCVPLHQKHYCHDDYDCSDPWHGQCSVDKRCTCKINNIASNDWTCSPTIGGYCWKTDQCVTKNSVCIDYQCKCKPTFVAVANNLCLPE